MCGATTDIVIASTIQIGNISACVRTKQFSCEAVEVTLQVYFMYITDCNAKFFKLPTTSANKLECTMPAIFATGNSHITASVSALIWYGQSSV